MNVTVLEALRNAMFRVRLETGQDTTRRHSDRRAVPQYDLTRGRLIYRK